MKKPPFRSKTGRYGKTSRNLSKMGWFELSDSQKHTRSISLKVLSMMMGGKSLSSSAEELKISVKTVKTHVRSAIRKSHGRWKPKKTDGIERAMVINERGRSKTILVSDSAQASMIGKYHNAVKQFLETGDESLLWPFKKIRIVDSSGKKHKLETDPQKLYDIDDAKENSEFYDIYGE
jgi:hypothetical protein